MTSLMDVMFLVLVFFIYSIFDMAVHKGVKVELPEGAGTDEKGERIVLTVRPDDSLEFNGEPATCESAVAKVRLLLAAKAEVQVLIAGDRASHLGTGMELLSKLKTAGVEKVSFRVSGRERPAAK